MTGTPQNNQDTGSMGTSTPGNSQSSNTGSISFDTNQTANTQNLTQNQLNNYMNVTYHVGFSMVQADDVHLIYNSPGANKVIPRTYPIASSGGTLTAQTKAPAQTPSGDPGEDQTYTPTTQVDMSTITFPYYAINKVTINNIFCNTAQNPLIATMVEGSMNLEQPYGFTLHKDLLRLALKMGYQISSPNATGTLNPGRIMYKLDFWWSGFDDNGQWFDRVTIYDSYGNTTNTLTYYVIIREMEAKPNSAKTEYTLSLSPFQTFNMRPEALMINTTSSLPFGANFGTFLQSLKDFLVKERKQNTTITTQNFNIQYEFSCPQILADQSIDANQLEIEPVTKVANGEMQFTTAQNVDILTLIKSVLDSIPWRQELLLNNATDNYNFTRPSIQFQIRFNCKYDLQTKNVQQGNTFDCYNITYHYYIEPFISFKKAPVWETDDPSITSLFMLQESQQQRLLEMIKLGLFVRRYDYFFTGDNTEVIDFNFRYKLFYFMALMPHLVTSPGSAGSTVYAPANTLAQATTSNYQQAVTPDNIAGVKATQTALFGNTQVGGQDPAILEQGRGEIPRASSSNMNPGAADSKERFLAVYNNFLDNDMMTIESLIVRGDPIWMISPYSPIVQDASNYYLKVKGGTFTTSDDSTDKSETLMVHGDKYILVKAYSPDQSTYMSGLDQVSSETSTLGGIYQVYKVESIFEGGKFTQNISGIKIPHINYSEKTNDNTVVTQAPKS